MLIENLRLLTADEVGKVLNKPKGVIYKLTRDGEFDQFLVAIGARSYRYRPDGLEVYISRGGRAVQEKTAA
jgi:hypothetical protein